MIRALANHGRQKIAGHPGGGAGIMCSHRVKSGGGDGSSAIARPGFANNRGERVGQWSGAYSSIFTNSNLNMNANAEEKEELSYLL